MLQIDPMMMSQQQNPNLPSIPTPSAMIIKQATMSPLPAHRIQPSPTPSRRSVNMPSLQMQHHSPIMTLPQPPAMFAQRHSPSPQPSMRSGFINGQRPPSVLSRQSLPPVSPLASPLVHHRMQPHRSLSPLPRRPSPSHSPRASMVRRSPPASPRASVRQSSPPSSPRISMRMRSPQPSTVPAQHPFREQKMRESPSPPLSPGHQSPPLSPKLSRRPSPSPSRQSLSPAGPRPVPSSPTLSRRSTRLLRDPTPLARPRMGGNVPLGTVRPSPMGLRGRPVPPPTQNVRPFRASSLRSNRSSVLTIDSSLHSSPLHSPHMIHRAPLQRRESGRLPFRPIARGRPLMAQQSIRSMPPASPQLSLKHMSRSASPRLSPRLHRHSYAPGSHANPYTEQSHQFASPSTPMLSHSLHSHSIPLDTFSSPFGPELPQMVGMGETAADFIEPDVSISPGAMYNQAYSPSVQRPMSPYQHPLPPSSPVLSGALQNQAVREASYVSPLQRPQSPYAQSVPSSPMLSGAMQNQAMREASYVSPLLRPQSPYAQSVPSSPILSGAMRHGQAVRRMTSYQTPQLHSPYGPTVITPYDHISEPGPAPLLQDALQTRTDLQNVSTFKSPMMQRRNVYSPTAPQLHGALQQNPNLRQASFQTPVQFRQSIQGPQSPSSPMLGSALQNRHLTQASYRLPDGTLMSPYADPRSSPMLGHALQNQQIRSASYIMPDGSIVRVCIKLLFFSHFSPCYVCIRKRQFQNYSFAYMIFHPNTTGPSRTTETDVT